MLRNRSSFDGRTLELYLKENIIDVVALNETFLSKKHSLIIPGYDTIRNDRSTGQKGCVAILVKQTIYCPNGNPNLTLFQTINNLSGNVMFIGDFNSKLESFGCAIWPYAQKYSKTT